MHGSLDPEEKVMDELHLQHEKHLLFAIKV